MSASLDPFHRHDNPPLPSSSSDMIVSWETAAAIQIQQLFRDDLLQQQQQQQQQRQTFPATITVASNVGCECQPDTITPFTTRATTSSSKTATTTKTRPFMVALVGIPGSGKSTSSRILANLLQAQYDIGCVVIPHDGYHYPLAVLEQFPDATAAIYRRGAPDTFDAAALVRDLHRIRYGDSDGASGCTTTSNTVTIVGGNNNDTNDNNVGNASDESNAFGSNDTIAIPGFDHAVGDPQPNAHTFQRHRHGIVLCEGLYLLHDQDGWQSIAHYFDWTIYLDADLDTCMDQLKIRNACIPGYTPEQIAIRVDEIDRRNAFIVMQSQSRAHVVYRSINSNCDASALQ